MEIVVYILLGFFILLSAFMLYREFQHLADRVSGLEKRIHDLEKANRARMPYDALEKLEHARAALNREKEERLFHISLIENAEAWLQNVMATGTKREEK